MIREKPFKTAPNSWVGDPKTAMDGSVEHVSSIVILVTLHADGRRSTDRNLRCVGPSRANNNTHVVPRQCGTV